MAANPNPKFTPAPDGGPQSHVLMPQQRSRLIPVTLVGNSSRRLMIAREDFDPKRHVAVGGHAPKAEAPAGRVKVRPTYGTEKKAELLTWTIKRLKDLPEVAEIKTPSGSKADLVDQILQVRAAAAE